MEYKKLRQLDLKIGDIIEDDQGKRGVVWFVEKDSIKATYPDGNCRHYDMDIAQYKKIIAEPKLEVGQYWHHLEAGTEILIQQRLTGLFTKSGRWVDADGELGNERDFEGDKIAYSLVKSILSRGYVLGRHPDNIEAAHPEQWQPKEGELVWNSMLKMKCRVFIDIYSDALRWAGCDLKTGDWHSSSDFEGCKPYREQDKPTIDFSLAGQWLRWGRTIFKTNGVEDGDCFFGSYLGDGQAYGSKINKGLNWQLLTPEQIQPILELIANI